MEGKKQVYRRPRQKPAAGAGAPAPAHGREGTRPGALLALFFALLFGFTLLDLFWPKREASELESRRLAAFPKVSAQALLNGSWTAGLTAWMQDQVAFRDGWLHLESALTDTVFAKAEENGILLGKDGWMFTKQFTAPGDQLRRNLNAVTSFTAKHADKTTFLLAPSAAVIYPEMLPAGAPMIDENAFLDAIFADVAATGARTLDLRQAFAASKAAEPGTQLFYKTDHHWTTDGAYLAYLQFCELRGLAPFDISAAGHTAVQVPGFFGTHYSSTRRLGCQGDVLAYYPLPNLQSVYEATGEAAFQLVETKGLMDEEELAKRNKYAAFLGGNEGYVTIEGDGQGSILVIKDSYANCFVPFLTANYADIGLVDLRNYRYGLDSLIEACGYDEVLILYNFQSFVSDNSVTIFGRASEAGGS